MDMTLVEFLLARIADDEAVASGHEGTAYHSWDFTPYADALGGQVGPRYAPIAADWHGTAYVGVAEHIARHDPARVLAECESKRRIVERQAAYAANQGRAAEDCPDLRWLAHPYADHPDYDESWRP